MSVLNVPQFYSKECPRVNKDYDLTKQSEWVYGEKEMILFARRYLQHWKKRMGFNKRTDPALHKHIVIQQSELLNAFFEYLDSLPPKEYDANSLTEHGENWLKSI